jgi:UDPglucose 6-dehydrogenase
MVDNDICVEIEEKKIALLNRCEIPIYEPGLEAMVTRNIEKKHLCFTTDFVKAIKNAEICIICVGTPMREDGSANMEHIFSAADSIGKYMRQKMIIINKSTVPTGAADKVRERIQEQLDLRKSDLTFEMASVPEFLKQGSAVKDCMTPDRIIIGVDSSDAEEKIRLLFTPFSMNTENLIFMDIKSAEMTKYAANAMLATKISLMNEISNICELVGADVNLVRRGIGSDNRIGYSFIYPGCGYGGSCLPKDLQALIHMGKENGYTPILLDSADRVNSRQKNILSDKVKRHFGNDLRGKLFAVWGLTFKPDTDDMREAPAINIIRNLVEVGAKIAAYDPKGRSAAENCWLKDLSTVRYTENKYDALNGADALLLITEWKEFRSPDFERMAALLKQPLIFDGRNQYDNNALKKIGFTYYQIGVQ